MIAPKITKRRHGHLSVVRFSGWPTSPRVIALTFKPFKTVSWRLSFRWRDRGLQLLWYR